jgi:mannitol/fructose-specific phosphotransferase system IIA component (Ntr-type)
MVMSPIDLAGAPMKGEELLRFFDSKRCIFDLQATTKEEALAEIIDKISPAGSSTNQMLLDMLHNREQLGSTGVVQGVAFPHGRSLAVSRLMAVFARSTSGVPFDSMDGAPTHLFFALLAPPQDRANQYLPALGRIVETVQDDALRARLMQVSSFEDFAAVMREG